MNGILRINSLVAGILVATLFLSAESDALVIRQTKKKKAESAAGPALPRKNLCGPWAYLVAVTRQGIPCSFGQILRELPVLESGVSFGDLAKQARKQGLAAKLTKLTWDQLKNQDTPVVVWVDGDHFLTADPREVNPEKKDAIRFYDHGSPASWLAREQLENRWAGEALIVRSKASGAPPNHPRLRWESCLEDFGWVDPYQKKYVFRYAFHNTGGQPLEVRIAKVGCGCAHAEVDPNVVASGGEGLVRVTVDLTEKRGYFSTSVLLSTNDPLLAKCEVIVSGGVFQPVLTSVDTVYAGQVQRGTRLTKSFFVQDRGDQTLRIKGLRALLGQRAGASDAIACEVESVLMQESNIPAGAVSRYPVRPGDYLVNLGLQIRPDAPDGPFEGTIQIQTNQPGRFAAGQVAFKGTVVPDVYADPPALLLSRQQPQAELRLKSDTRQSITVRPPQVSGDAAVSIETLGSPNGFPAYRVGAQDFAGADVHRGRIVFQLDDNSSITVPIVVYTGRQ
jgi:predicted double-glycine peptidase